MLQETFLLSLLLGINPAPAEVQSDAYSNVIDNHRRSLIENSPSIWIPSAAELLLDLSFNRIPSKVELLPDLSFNRIPPRAELLPNFFFSQIFLRAELLPNSSSSQISLEVELLSDISNS